MNTRHALVTGGAGLIGSHLVDLLLERGWPVRILDSLEPQTHRQGKPDWIPARADFQLGDIRDRSAVRAALDGIDVVFHLAAYGGYMPEIAKFIDVNSLGTARLLEIIRDERLPVQKLVLASSQVVYPEGAVVCAEHGRVFPSTRPLDQLVRGEYSVACPLCGAPTTGALTPETAPLATGTTYAISKLAQEQLVLSWSRQTGIPAVALRYPCTYGPRQSRFNPYTGVIAIFTARLLNGLPPVIYEDGQQERDFCFVEDVARANLLAAESDRLDGHAVNVGSGSGTSILSLATRIARALGVECEPLLRGEYRPGEIRRLVTDTSLIEAAGWSPRVGLDDGIARHLDWVRTQERLDDDFTRAEQRLRSRGIVQAATAQPLVSLR
jgi:dTDP-L-rhamnose 4-epimerase